MSWMIYGANGYTGELIAREAVARGMKPIVAGRSSEKIEPLAAELQLEARIFALDDPELLARSLEGVRLVLHCAGPFIHTSEPMVRACLRSGTHYLDITGEIAVFERIFAVDAEARQHKVILLPGVGFDVVPTDCLAAMLAKQLPGADDLILAFYSPRSKTSRGTTMTMIEGLGSSGAIRRNGVITPVPWLFDLREIEYGPHRRLSVTIPWGDISTAYRSTGIANIRVYTAIHPRAVRVMKLARPLLAVAALTPVKRMLQRIASSKKGPDAELRLRGETFVWGAITSSDGGRVSMSITVAEPYQFTVMSSIEAVKRVLESDACGAFTPSLLFGSDFVETIPRTTVGRPIRT